MHEVFITRADYGRKDGQERIFTPWNCALICRSCHMIMGSVLQVRLGKILLDAYGADKIERGIASLNLRTWKGLDAWFAQRTHPKASWDWAIMRKSELAHFMNLLHKEGRI